MYCNFLSLLLCNPITCASSSQERRQFRACACSGRDTIQCIKYYTLIRHIIHRISGFLPYFSVFVENYRRNLIRLCDYISHGTLRLCIISSIICSQFCIVFSKENSQFDIFMILDSIYHGIFTILHSIFHSILEEYFKVYTFIHMLIHTDV